jgi:hypothetical protein
MCLNKSLFLMSHFSFFEDHAFIKFIFAVLGNGKEWKCQTPQELERISFLNCIWQMQAE